MTGDLEEQAFCWLAIGQLAEHAKNFDAAVGPKRAETRYAKRALVAPRYLLLPFTASNR
jgi:hypothetical protein